MNYLTLGTLHLVAGISANFPILVMYLFDKCLARMGYYGSSSPNKMDTATSTVYVPLRESIVFLLLSDALLLFWLIPYEHYEFIIMLLLDARDTMYTFSVLSCLTKFSNPVWTMTSVVLIGAVLFTQVR